MKKINKKLVIIGLLIILLLAGIGVNKLYAATKRFGLADLLKREAKDGSTVFCIAHEYHIKRGTGKDPDQYNYTQDHIINIEGDKATSSGRESTKESNAILAYICRAASNENIDNYTRDSNLNYDNRYKKTPSQNAIWDYWDDWYRNNKNILLKSDGEIDRKYNKSSEADYDKLADSVLAKARSYYNVLNGKEGVKVLTAESGKTEGTTYGYYGPYKVKKTSSYVTTLNINQENQDVKNRKILGFVNANKKNLTSSITLSNNYYEFYIRVSMDYTTSKFEDVVNYSVTQYNATLKLFSYYSNNYDERFQNLAEVTTSETTKTIKLDFNVKNAPGAVSIQKYIAQSGMSITTTNGTATFYNNENYAYRGRLNKKATINSGTDISRVRTNNDEFYTAGLFSDGTTKSQNPYMIQKGEYVVYRIAVYNNSNTDTITCRVREKTDASAELIGIFKEINITTRLEKRRKD